MLPKEVTEDLVPQVIFNRIKFKPFDVCIMLSVAIFSAVVFLYASGVGDMPAVCVIEVNGEEFARYDLSSLTQEKVIKIDNEFGKNTIVIDRHGAAVIYSDCADKTEVESGKITTAGQSLICLPHRLTVRLEGNEKTDVTAW